MNSYRRRTPLTSATLRARRRRRARLMTVLVVLAILAIAGGFCYLVRAPFLRIQTIQVTGADEQSETEIATFIKSQLAGNYRFFVPRNHVWEYSRLDLSRSVLAAFPRLARATVTLQSLTSLSVVVSERLPKALWCGQSADTPSSGCLVLDNMGAAYEPLATSSLAYVTYYGALDTTASPPQFLPSGEFRALSELIDTFGNNAGAGPPIHAAIDTDGNVSLKFQDGFVLLFMLSDATGQQDALLERLSLALQSAPFVQNRISDFEYLDMRFGDSIYYKLKFVDSQQKVHTTATSTSH